MDKTKLKIKHLYGLYKLSPSYPTLEDVLFEWVTHIESNNLNRVLVRNDFKRVAKLPEGYTILSVMDEFINLGYFEKTGEGFILKKHPWL
jgi:hypothetical protein